MKEQKNIANSACLHCVPGAERWSLRSLLASSCGGDRRGGGNWTKNQAGEQQRQIVKEKREKV